MHNKKKRKDNKAKAPTVAKMKCHDSKENNDEGYLWKYYSKTGSKYNFGARGILVDRELKMNAMMDFV